jgi:hypothetical protein
LSLTSLIGSFLSRYSASSHSSGGRSRSRPTFRQRRHRPLVPQQRFRRHHDQRLAEVAFHLAAQNVEVVRRRGAVGDLHVVFRAHLQEALEPGRGVLRPLAFIAVRQQADEARHAQPLALARRDELVEQHLRAVGEVAELGFPQRQRIRLGQRVAVFEAEHRLFRQHRVDDFVARLARDIGERRCSVSRSPDRRAPNGAARTCRARILARQADLGAFLDQRAEGQRSAVAQSMPSPVSIILARLSMNRWMVRWALKSAGTADSFLPSFLQRLIGTGLAAALLVLVVGLRGPTIARRASRPCWACSSGRCRTRLPDACASRPSSSRIRLGDHAFLDQAAA